MKFIVGLSCAALATCIGGSALTGTARAQSISAPRAEAAETLTYWTAERLKVAKPKSLTPTTTFSRSTAEAATPTGPGGGLAGAAPSVSHDESLAIKLYDVPDTESELMLPPAASPTAVGTAKYPYTINRLYPTVGNTTSNIYTIYPYQTVGQLFFTEPSGDFVCSASVIRLSVIATAGHCVADGKGHFYTHWLFIPALHAGVAPYGSWNWAQVFVAGPWWNGGGAVPNRQDDALIVLQQNGSNQKIGQLTGYLGFEYNAPLPTHLTQLGYPCNLDGCNDPVQNYAQVYSGPNNNFEWGTAAFGGASGGPQVQDFGQKPSGGPPPNEAFGGNVLISSTSYTYGAAAQVDGGSILAAPGQFGGSLNTFGDLINAACATAGNC
jgi:V8-like Glu-specific endopeptidase